MTGRLSVLLLGLAATVLALPVNRARADAIDGNWCFTDGRHMSIDGPRIVTPGGKRIEGEYGRHSFSYTVPASEPGAGSIIGMIQLNEQTIHVRRRSGTAGTAPGKVQVWRRCSLTTSWRRPKPRSADTDT